MIHIIGLVFHAFDLTNARLQPFMEAFGETVIRIAVAAAIAFGLFAPTRPHWRLPQLNDRAAAGIVRTAISLACIVFGDPPFRSAQRHCWGLLAGRRHDARARRLAGRDHARGGVVALRQHTGYRRYFRPRGRQGEGSWFGLLRLVSWAVTFAIAVSVLIGYAAFGSFLLEQFFWVCAVASMLFMSIVLAEEAIGAGLAPTTPIGHRLVTSIGFNRNSLELTGVLFAGLIRLVLFIVAAGLVLAPWGFSGAMSRLILVLPFLASRWAT